MRLMARTFNFRKPVSAGVNSVFHSRKEYRPRSWPNSASRQVLPSLWEKRTALIPYPPSKAKPFTDVGEFFFSSLPFRRFVMNERTLYRLMGTVLSGFVPGWTQAQALSG